MLNSIQDAVNLLLPAKRGTNANSGWVKFDAPCCEARGLTKRRVQRGGLIANPDGALTYHCFNCGFKTNYTPGRHLSFKFKKWLAWLGADENTVNRLVIEAIRVHDLMPPEARTEVKEERTEVVYKPRPLPEGAISFSELISFYELNNWQNVIDNFHDAMTYIDSRRIDMDTYDFYITDEKAYNLHKRVIVPFTWKNETIGYTARAVADGVNPKYHTSHDANYVFNIDRQRPNSQFVIVCEGPFDAMSIDGVAILGNSCSRVQADIIEDLEREVIVVPDADAAGTQLIDQAILYGWTVSYPIWLGDVKDINEAVVKYGRLFVLKSILQARETNRLKIELHKRKLYN